MSKTVELGVIKRSEGKDGELGDPYIALDGKVKEVKLTMMMWDKDKKAEVEKEVSLVANDKGKFYINAPTVQDTVEFMVEQGYMTEERANTRINSCAEYNISRILTAKVE